MSYLPVATYRGEPVVRLDERGNRVVVDEGRLRDLYRQLKGAKAYLAAIEEEIRATVEECSPECLEIVEESGGFAFVYRAPLYDELPDIVRELVPPEAYDRLLAVSVSELEKVFESAWKDAGRGTKKDGAAVFRAAVAPLCEARAPRRRLRERRD